MSYQKFDIAKLEKLNDPGRFDTLIPEEMWAALGNPTPSIIVEIGAGTGLFADRFADMVLDATVYAVDIEPQMIEWMKENRAKAESGRLVPLLSEETNVPLADGIADLVAMINLHHELVDPIATYTEAHRLLALDGQILIVDWAPIETPRGPSLQHRASVEAICATLETAGFNDVKTHAVLPWHTVVTAVKSK